MPGDGLYCSRAAMAVGRHLPRWGDDSGIPATARGAQPTADREMVGAGFPPGHNNLRERDEMHWCCADSGGAIGDRGLIAIVIWASMLPAMPRRLTRL
jgi:hypothetical protein